MSPGVTSRARTAIRKAASVQDDCQVNELVRPPNIGDVRDPELIDRVGPHVSRQIRIHGLRVPRISCHDKGPFSPQAEQVVFALSARKTALWLTFKERLWSSAVMRR